MYIIELLLQAFKRKKKNDKIDDYNPMISESIEEDSDTCDHLFMPLDSSNTMFACKYCGLVVPKEKLKNKNIFENKSF